MKSTSPKPEIIPEGKIKKGLMIEEFRFPGYSDTVTTVAANAFLRFLTNLTTNEELREKYDNYGIDGFYGASESRDELSKPLPMDVLELVEPVVFTQNGYAVKETLKEVSRDLRFSDSFEAKFACTALAKLAHIVSTSIQSGAMNSAVVMSSDFGLYDPSKAEDARPTQGMAAVLLYITRDPLLVSLDRRAAHYNLPAYDFFKHGEHTPRVPFGFGSQVDNLLNSGSALERYEELYGLPKKYFVVGHLPNPKQAYYNSSPLHVHRERKAGRLSKLEEELGEKEPIGGARTSLEFLRNVVREYNSAGNQSKDIIESFDSHPGIEKLWDFHKKVRGTEGFTKFSEQIGLQYSLIRPAKVGNSYNGAMFVGEGSLLEYLPSKTSSRLVAFARKIGHATHTLGYDKIVHISYGSGSGTSVYVGEIVEESQERRRRLIDMSSLDVRRELSVEEYEALHKKRIEKPDFTRTEDSIALDKQILRDRFVGTGFKLERFKENKIGEYQFNGQRVKLMPIML